MIPGNPVVGGVILRRPAIQSPDYVAGSAGWAINADGTAQFNSVTFYGPSGLAVQISANGVQLNPAGLLPAGGGGYVNADVPGDVILYSGTVSGTDTAATVEATSAQSSDNTSGGLTNISLIAQTVTLNATTSSDIPHAHVTGLPLAGAATLADVITAVNNLYAALQAVAVIAP
jgi:hypothetical protein